MITFLKIKNFAIIDEVEINLTPGFNVITGETGAGKTILVNAVKMLMGERASFEVVRQGEDDAEIQGLFSQLNPQAIKLLQDQKIPLEEGELSIRRIISKNGSHKIFINDKVVSLSFLRDLTQKLVSISGQNDQQLLLNSDNQLNLLDQWAKSEDLALELKIQWTQVLQARNFLTKLKEEATTREEKIEYLSFQLQELQKLRLDPLTDEALEKDLLRYQGAQDLATMAGVSEHALYADEGAISQIEKVIKTLKNNLKYDISLEPAFQKLQSLVEELESWGAEILAYKKRLNYDPNRVGKILDRLETLKKYKKRYGVDIAGLVAKQSQLQNDLETLNDYETNLLAAQAQLKTLEDQAQSIAGQLSGKRKSALKAINSDITKELQSLNMVGAKFEILLTPQSLNDSGLESIAFCIAPNKGEALLPIDKIASGGELSRIQLALAQRSPNTGSIIFDEIDAGIGGETGLVIGQKLKKLATKGQVLAVTHLSQVAVFGDTHLFLSKLYVGNRTVSSVKTLNSDERVKEIARMLGGKSSSAKAKEHASEMLNQAQKS